MIAPPDPDLGDRLARAADTEAALWEAFKATGSHDAREQLFLLHLPFARRLARRRFLGRSGADIEFQDLSQHASIGLLEAIDRFRPSEGVPFSAYARRRIAGAMTDGITKLNELREQISFRRRAASDRVHSLAPEQIAAGQDDAMGALAQLAVGLALGFMLEESGQSGVGEQADPSANAYESLAWRETVAQVHRAIEALPGREAQVIRHHYLNGLAFGQIGLLLGISKGRVSQLHKGAIDLLRKRLPRAVDFHLKG